MRAQYTMALMAVLFIMTTLGLAKMFIDTYNLYDEVIDKEVRLENSIGLQKYLLFFESAAYYSAVDGGLCGIDTADIESTPQGSDVTDLLADVVGDTNSAATDLLGEDEDEIFLRKYREADSSIEMDSADSEYRRVTLYGNDVKVSGKGGEPTLNGLLELRIHCP